tara:strand:- start:22548 stop:24977 length:2430 start_codon:yes stop_codon:yes gene_type:complete
MPRFVFLLLVFCLPIVVGCEGCRPQGDAADETDEQAPVQDYTAKPAEAFPGGNGPIAGGIKPGHWLTAMQSLKSNRADARGQLRSDAVATGTNLSGQAVDATPGQSIPSVRPVVLPKGQERRIDFRLLAPVPLMADQSRVTLGSRFVSSGASVYFDAGRQPFYVMSGEEYFFVILTNRPERFAKFQVADWVRPFRDEASFQDKSANYRVVVPPTDGMLPLAETMLDWTSTAYVLWDDLSPDALTPAQATAMADWLRFGGQLIINGADAADGIAKTKLADVMPLKPTGNIQLDADAGASLLKNWSVRTDRSTDAQIALLRSQSGRIAVDGKLVAGAYEVKESANLLLARRVGRGRVVQSRFDMTSDWLSQWKSFDSFLNAAVLLRPRREYVDSVDVMSGSFTSQRYADSQLKRAVPTVNTRFHIAARDAVLRGPATAVADDSTAPVVKVSNPNVGFGDSFTRYDLVSGTSAWNDNSDAIRTAREILIDEAGIEIPESSLIAKSLAYYLILLVPVNYIVFRLLGRLEYAWLAVPLIAVGGALWVARLARLDIGFARSQTEIAVLEMHAGYPRGHLSRIVAIYNSLSSRYDVQFDRLDAAALPVQTGNDIADSSEVVFKTSFAEGPSLSGVPVASGRTQHIHAEQMIDLGGSIVRQEESIRNGTEYELFDVFVIEKDDSGDVRVASVGAIAPGGTVLPRFKRIAAAAISDELPMQSVALLRKLASSASMPSGSARLVGRIDQSLPGMTITPTSNQLSGQTLVLAHLTAAPLPVPQPDVNLVADLRRVNKLDPSKNQAIDDVEDDDVEDDETE